MIRYAITERCQFDGDEVERRLNLFLLARTWALEQVDYIQLREKDLPARELEQISRSIIAAIHAVNSKTKLLINSRAKVAIAAAADGVHLTTAEGELTPEQVRTLFARAGLPPPVISISCHTLQQVANARSEEVDLILFGPVFGKTVSGVEVVSGIGLEALRQACEKARHVPVLALGGINESNAQNCMQAGAKGIAAIRFFANVIRGKMQKS